MTSGFSRELVFTFGTAGHREVARMLIDRGADVSARDKDGRTPMRLASQVGQLEAILMLFVHGADASVQN
jgi:ankyrin repeat protein